MPQEVQRGGTGEKGKEAVTDNGPGEDGEEGVRKRDGGTGMGRKDRRGGTFSKASDGDAASSH